MTQREGLTKIGYAALGVLTAAGAWGVLSVFRHGHALANTTQHVPWGLWVALYIFFLGMSTGAYLLSSLVYVFRVKRFEAAGPMALLQALGCLVLGGFLIIMDLGHPLRIYKVLLSMNPTSVMGWMGLLYNFYIVIVVAQLVVAIRPQVVQRVQSGAQPAWLYRWLACGSTDLTPEGRQRDARRLKILGIAGLPVTILVSGGVGVLFAVAKARPNWFSGLFPIIFLISALASGGALLTFLMAFGSRQPEDKKRVLVRDLAMLTIGILCFDWLLFLSEVLVTFYGNIPHEVIGWRLTLFGPYWWVFWFVQLGVGTLVPIGILLRPRLRASSRWLGAAGLLAAFGILGTRLNIVIPPQIRPVFEALPDAYSHARNAVGYFPSLYEWLVAAFTFAVGIWLFVAARNVLPLEQGSDAR